MATRILTTLAGWIAFAILIGGMVWLGLAETGVTWPFADGDSTAPLASPSPTRPYRLHDTYLEPAYYLDGELYYQVCLPKDGNPHCGDVILGNKPRR